MCCVVVYAIIENFTKLFAEDHHEEREEYLEEEEQRSMESRGDTPYHDDDTLDCLEIEFPPFYFSTHGLSRAASPEPEQKER